MRPESEMTLRSLDEAIMTLERAKRFAAREPLLMRTGSSPLIAYEFRVAAVLRNSLNMSLLACHAAAMSARWALDELMRLTSTEREDERKN